MDELRLGQKVELAFVKASAAEIEQRPEVYQEEAERGKTHSLRGYIVQLNVGGRTRTRFVAEKDLIPL